MDNRCLATATFVKEVDDLFDSFKADSHIACRSTAMPCVNSHMPCRAPALFQQCCVLRKSPRGSQKYPNC
jgi:hypothetical protein